MNFIKMADKKETILKEKNIHVEISSEKSHIRVDKSKLQWVFYQHFVPKKVHNSIKSAPSSTIMNPEAGDNNDRSN